MAWLRSGDEAATYPKLMSVMGMQGVDSRTLNELAGFVWRAATMGAAHWTDYVIDLGTLMMLGNGRHEELIRLAVAAGLMEWIEVDGIRKVKILEDTSFLHMLSKEGSEWERQRDNDNRDPGLKGPVILRDGDNCRYCGREVYWSGPSGNRKGTLDHRVPGKPGTVATMVVSCTLCNSQRQDDETGTWDRDHPLLPIPPKPKYGAWARRYFLDHGIRTDLTPSTTGGTPAGLPHASETPSVGDLAGKGEHPGPASHEVEPGASAGISEEVDPGTHQGASAGPRSDGPGAGGPLPKSPPRVAGESHDQSQTRGLGSRDLPGRDGTGRAGPGRDSSGRHGSGRSGTGSKATPRSGKHKRRRRR